MDIEQQQSKSAGSAARNRPKWLAERAEVGDCQPLRGLTVHDEEDTHSVTLAAALAICGETTQAAKIADTLHRETPTATLRNAVEIPGIRARIALSQKRPEQAIEQLRSAIPYERAYSLINYDRGQAYLAAGKGAEAAAQFQTVLDHPGSNRLTIHYALSYVGVARAATLTGDRVKAKKAYEDFVALWKDADKDIPILQEARKEYASLP